MLQKISASLKTFNQTEEPCPSQSDSPLAALFYIFIYFIHIFETCEKKQTALILRDKCLFYNVHIHFL